jgi:hypothetical protein
MAFDIRMPRDSHSVHQSAETPTFGCNLRAIQNEGLVEVPTSTISLRYQSGCRWGTMVLSAQQYTGNSSSDNAAFYEMAKDTPE